MAGDDRTASRSGRGVLLATTTLVVLGAVFWAFFWSQSADSVLTRVPILDEEWYLWEAARLRDEGLAAGSPLVMSPGYPLLVAGGGGVATTPPGILVHHPHRLLAMQALAWLGCGLLVGAVVHGSARRAGLGAGTALVVALATVLLFLLYRPAAIFARTILLEMPLTFLVAAAVAAATARRPGVLMRTVLAGLCLGAAATLRAHVLVLLLVLVPVVWRAATARNHRFTALGLLVILALGPVTLAAGYNSRLSGRAASPSLNVGLNLYLGQAPTAGGLFLTVAGFDQQHDPSGQAYLESRLGRELSGPAEADRVWLAEARDLIAAAPGRALVGWCRKVWLHLQGWEIAQVTPLGAWPRQAPVLRVLVVPWGLLVVGALVGVTLTLSAGRAGAVVMPVREIRIWAAAGGLLVAVQSVFFVVSRYRLVLAPILVVLLGLGLVTVVALARDGNRRAWLPSLVALPLAVLLVVPWGLAGTQQTWSGLEAFNEARRLLVLAEARPGGDLREQAEMLLERTCTVAPERPGPWRLRADNLVRMGRTVEALAVLSDGVMLVSDPGPLERARIAVLLDAGRLDAAEALVLAFLREHPDDVDMLHDLVVLQGRRGRWPAALESARRLRSLAPDDHRGWLDLAVALARLNRGDEAIAVLEDGLSQLPAGEARALLAENLRRLRQSPATR